MFRRILTPLDGSEYGERALAYARDLAQTSGARVHLLSVVLTGDSPVVPLDRKLDEVRRVRWAVYLEGHAATLREAGVAEVMTDVRFGEPAIAIADAARELRADLIVMTTQGLGADARSGLGGVALKVLMTAPCPVLMVRINRPEPPRTLAEEQWQAEGGRNVG